MSNPVRRDHRAFSEARPLVVHVENSSSLKPVFIVHAEEYQAALTRHPDVARLVKTTMGFDAENYDESMKEADALVSYRFPRDNLRQRAPHLKWIQVLGAGVDYMLPLDWVPEDLMLTTNFGAHVPKASQSALMAILMINSRIPTLVTEQRRHEWTRIFTTTVEGKTLAIIGVGHIGGGVADQAKKVGMRVIGIRRSAQPHPAVDEMYASDALHTVLPRADVVLLNTALTSQTRFLMGRKEFELMKPGAGFINMSRGGLVDPKALEESLRSGHLGGAMIDVSYPEPLPPDSTLWDAPNLIITPHVLSDDIEQYIPRTLDIFFDNIRCYLEGKPLRNVVDLKREY